MSNRIPYEPTELLSVHLDAREQRRKVGRLALQNQKILFEYDPTFIALGIELSPVKMPIRPGVLISDTTIFEGLFGVFNDSLPDGWGRLLLDRTVELHGINRRLLNPLDRLAYVGRKGMGALSYEPELGESWTDDRRLSLDKLSDQAASVLTGENEEVFEDLLQLNGAAGGARPKIVAQVSTDKKTIIHGQRRLQAGFEHWMIKFASTQDARDIGAIEYAYSLMAKDAGIDMPETHLFLTKKNKYFGTRRFDRDGDTHIHMQTLGGLIHADHRNPTVDYDTVLRVTLALTKSFVEVEKMYALACFNVLAHNRDDHVKNFSFLLNANGEWTLAPAYDLVFSYGPGGEQSMLVMGEGKRPGVTQLLALGKQHGLKNAPHIVSSVQSAVAGWPRYAREVGVSVRSIRDIASAIAFALQ